MMYLNILFIYLAGIIYSPQPQYDDKANCWADKDVHFISAYDFQRDGKYLDPSQTIRIRIEKKHFYFEGNSFDNDTQVPYKDLIKRIDEGSYFNLCILISQDEPLGRFNKLRCLLGDKIDDAANIYVIF